MTETFWLIIYLAIVLCKRFLRGIELLKVIELPTGLFYLKITNHIFRVKYVFFNEQRLISNNLFRIFFFFFF